MNPIGGLTVDVVTYALDGLEQRSQVRAHNVANLNTPGFGARDVDFQSTLRRAVAGSPAALGTAPQVVRGRGMPDALGNNVDLETEMVGMMQDNLLRDAMVSAFNYKIDVMRTAIGGRP